jgi:hypothetical protein
VTDQQLYMAIGFPTVTALIGILVNIGYFVSLNGRINTMESRLDGRLDRLDDKFEILTGKVIELDNRLSRLEERLKH